MERYRRDPLSFSEQVRAGLNHCTNEQEQPSRALKRKSRYTLCGVYGLRTLLLLIPRGLGVTLGDGV
jgi:hypothetical protein